MKCKDVMSQKIKWCTPDCTAKEAVKIMKEENCGVIPVVDEKNKIKGIVTDRDITFFLVLKDKDPEKTKLKEFMSKDVITCKENDDLDKLVHRMKKYKVRRIPIVDKEDKLQGMISLGDIAVKVPKKEHKTYEALEKISEPVHR